MRYMRGNFEITTWNLATWKVDIKIRERYWIISHHSTLVLFVFKLTNNNHVLYHTGANLEGVKISGFKHHTTNQYQNCKCLLLVFCFADIISCVHFARRELHKSWYLQTLLAVKSYCLQYNIIKLNSGTQNHRH
jgi:hypothetical protein